MMVKNYFAPFIYKYDTCDTRSDMYAMTGGHEREQGCDNRAHETMTHECTSPLITDGQYQRELTSILTGTQSVI